VFADLRLMNVFILGAKQHYAKGDTIFLENAIFMDGQPIHTAVAIFLAGNIGMWLG